MWPLLSFCSSPRLCHVPLPLGRVCSGNRGLINRPYLTGAQTKNWTFSTTKFISCCEAGAVSAPSLGPWFPCHSTASVNIAWINTTGSMACSVEVNCLWALTGNAHCTKRALNSLELLLRDEEGDWMRFLFSWLLGLILMSLHHYRTHSHGFCAHLHPQAGFPHRIAGSSYEMLGPSIYLSRSQEVNVLLASTCSLGVPGIWNLTEVPTC